MQRGNKIGLRQSVSQSDLRAEVEVAVSCMRNASVHNYRNSSFIVDLAMGQIPRSTERISSFIMNLGKPLDDVLPKSLSKNDNQNDVE